MEVVRNYLNIGWPVQPEEIKNNIIRISDRLEFIDDVGYFNFERVSLPRFIALAVIERIVSDEWARLALMHSIPEGKPRIEKTHAGVSIVIDNHYVVLGEKMSTENMFYEFIPTVGFYKDGKLWKTYLKGIGEVDVYSIRDVPEEFYGDLPFIRVPMSRILKKKTTDVHGTVEIMSEIISVGPIAYEPEGDFEDNVDNFEVKITNGYIKFGDVYFVDGWYWTSEYLKKPSVERINNWYYVHDDFTVPSIDYYYRDYMGFKIIAYPDDGIMYVKNRYGINIASGKYESDPVPTVEEIENILPWKKYFERKST